MRPATATNAGTATTRSVYSGVGPKLSLGRTNPSVQYVPTTGTTLVLNVAEVIQLTEEYYAPSSLGTFNLQIKCRRRTIKTKTGLQTRTIWLS
ncbi:MAG: major capsid protein V20 domain-containing protein [Candidatus Fonsibacter sp.]